MARRRGQQVGYVHRQGNAWYLAYREDALDADGKIIRVRRNVKLADDAKEVSKREAQRFAREILGEVDARAQRPMSLVTVGEFIEKRFKPDVIWSLKHAGQLHYAYVLDRHILPAIEHLLLRDVSTDHVQALVKKKFEDGYSVQTVVHIRNAVSAVFNHAKLKRAYAGDNPVQGVRLPEMQRRETHALSFAQGRELLAHLSSPVQEMALLSMTTSMNVAEMLGLRWERVNLTGEPVIAGSEVLQPYTLIVRENYYRGVFGTVKAKSRRRTVPLVTSVVTELIALRNRSKFTGPTDLVFSTQKGTPLDEHNLRRRELTPAGKELSIPWLSWHVFRHTHATLGDQIGMALADRVAQMGHGDLRMTMLYTHTDIERRRASIEKIAEQLTSNVGETGGPVN